MKAVDTSVVVAAFATWHEAHRAAFEALRSEPRLPAHVLVESYSVLTRLPPPHRVSADIAHRFLSSRFPDRPLTLRPQEHVRLLSDVARAGVTGGAVYDALVAATARQAGATLLTRDHRAARTYETIGVPFEFVGH